MFKSNCDTPQINPERHWRYIYEFFIKDSFEDELADVVIRCLDFAGHRRWDLQHALDNMPNKSELYKIFYGKTFAETAHNICSETIMAIDRESAVHSVLRKVVEYCNYKGIDLWWHVEQKMRYNELRPYRHGGKAY